MTYMTFYMMTIVIVALSVTVYEIFKIGICMRVTLIFIIIIIITSIFITRTFSSKHKYK